MTNNNPTPEETAAATEKAESSFHWTDILNYEKMFDLAGIEAGYSAEDQAFFWIMVMIYYIILFLPTWVVVRCLLFLILPKSWLKWMFKV